MRPKFLFPIGVLTLLASCQDIGDEMMQEIPELRTSVEGLTGIQHDIAVNVLARHFGGYTKGETSTRAAEEFSLTPYIVDGDTVMYIAQYQDGWEIYSGCHATNMVLFSSDEGQFSMDDPNMPDALHALIEGNARAIGELMAQDPNCVDPTWGYVAVSDEELEAAQVMALVDENTGERTAMSGENVPPGYWILIKSEKLEQTIKKVPKLTKTQWGQSSPWNAYAKWVNSGSDGNLVQAPAGCAPVAIAQYLYFTHFKDGKPASAPAIARLASDGVSYVFPIYSNSIWNTMAKTRYGLGNTRDVALLIGEIGHSIYTDYQLGGSSSNSINVCNYLNSTYNKSFSVIDFSYATVKERLDEGYPVITLAYSNTTTNGSNDWGGHLFMVDGYRDYTEVTKHTYGLVRYPLPPGTPDPWIADLKDSNGNIIQYAYTKEVIADAVAYQSITMNWGWEGVDDDIIYFPNDNWIGGGHIFNLDHYIYMMDE